MALALRLQGRVLLARGLRALGLSTEGLELASTKLGAPLLNLPDTALSFSYTDRACCLLALTPGAGRARIGVDWESVRLDSLPPEKCLPGGLKRNGGCAFGADLAPRTIASEKLRRWCLGEALLKAHGTGLAFNPGSIDAGPAGRRQGEAVIDSRAYAFRCLPLPCSWLCAAVEVRYAGLLHTGLEVLRAN